MKYIIISFLLFIYHFSIAQDTALAKMVISTATQNGENISQLTLDQGSYIFFYKDSRTDSIMMANRWPKNQSQSYGRLYYGSPAEYKKKYDEFTADFYYYKWKYANTYNSDTGMAKVILIKIYKSKGIEFEVNILPENLDRLVYHGIMEEPYIIPYKPGVRLHRHEAQNGNGGK